SLQLIKQIKSPIKIYSNYKDEKINLNYSKKIENFMQSIKKNSSDYISNYLIAREYFNQNEIEKAEIYANKSTKIKPNYSNPYNLLLDIYLRKDKPTSAKKALEKAFDIDATNIKTKIDLSKLYMHKKDYLNAISLLKEIINENPENPYPYSYIGFSYLFIGEYNISELYFNESKKLLEKGKESGENFACPYEGLGITYYQTYNYKKSKEFLIKSIELRPGLVSDKYKLLANIYEKEGNVDAAINITEQWLKFDPENPNVKYFYLLKKSFKEYLEGKYDKSIELIEKAKKIQPINAITYEETGWAYFKIFKYENAAQSFIQSINIDPLRHTSLSGLGLSLYYMERYDESKKILKKSLELFNVSDLTYTSLGFISIYEKKFENANEFLKKAISINQYNDLAYTGMGIINENNFTQAIDFYEKALEINPNNQKAYSLLIEILNKNNFSYKALEKIKKDIKLFPNNIYFQLQHALILSYMNNYTEAIKIMEYLIEITKNKDPILYSELGFIYSQKGDSYLAIENFKKSAEFFNISNKTYNYYSCPYDGLGMEYYKLNKLNESIINLKTAISINPNIDIKKYETLADIYFKKNELDKAIEIYKKILEIDSAKEKVYIELGLIYFELDKFNESSTIFKIALEKFPNNSMAMTGLAKIYIMTNEEKKAEPLIKKAINLDSKNSWMYHELGITYFMKNNYKSAKNMFKKSIFYDIKDDKKFNNLGWTYYELYKQNNNTKNNSYSIKAFEAFNKSLILNPKNVNALAGVGTLYNHLNKTNMALDLFNKVIKIKPDHKLTLYKLGRIYYTLKNYNVAIDMLNNAIKIAKKESHIPSEKDKKSLQSSYQVLALANYELNHFEEAISYLKKSLKIKTNIDHGDYNVLTEKETLKLLKLLNEKKK
ncbi:tetratricopeptide repeat protein, partial [archaeon]|nr:tetratricopeptide repeat protein [archaeon]